MEGFDLPLAGPQLLLRKQSFQVKIALQTADLRFSPRMAFGCSNTITQKQGRNSTIKVPRRPWLGIESLVKTFDSGEDEQNDINEIKQLLDETSGATNEDLAL